MSDSTLAPYIRAIQERLAYEPEKFARALLDYYRTIGRHDQYGLFAALIGELLAARTHATELRRIEGHRRPPPMKPCPCCGLAAGCEDRGRACVVHGPEWCRRCSNGCDRLRNRGVLCGRDDLNEDQHQQEETMAEHTGSPVVDAPAMKVADETAGAHEASRLYDEGSPYHRKR